MALFRALSGGGAVAPQFGGGLMGRTKTVLSEAAGHALATADQGLPLDGTDQIPRQFVLA